MVSTTPERRSEAGLRFRSALGEWDHVVSDLRLAGEDHPDPEATIAITTYKRQDLLVEAVRSALAQDFRRPFEILVLDNDPETRGPAQLLEQVPQLKAANFRYFVHRENIGFWGNMNRSIQLAKGKWIALLHDDDLLDANFLTEMFKVIDRRPQLGGLVSRKRWFGQRQDTSLSPRRMAKKLVLETMFAGRPTRLIPPAKLFWGAIVGSTGAGFIFRKACAVEIGGFYPEEYPSDHVFFARLGARFELRQHRAVLASIRKTDENLTGKVDAVRQQLAQGFRLQQALAGEYVPEWWVRRFSPLIAARDRSDFAQNWGVNLPEGELEEMLKMRVPMDQPHLLWLIRLIMRGF